MSERTDAAIAELNAALDEEFGDIPQLKPVFGALFSQLRDTLNLASSALAMMKTTSTPVEVPQSGIPPMVYDNTETPPP